MRISAGLVVGRLVGGRPEVLLAHPGGPFWARRDLGAWTAPKGLVEPGEDLLEAARREFFEETGLEAPGAADPLTPVVLKSGKRVHAFLVRADLSLEGFVSNRFTVEEPKGSGRMRSYPEIDRVAYFGAAAALERITPGQAPLIREALERLRSGT